MLLADRVLPRRGAMPGEDETTEHVRFINNYESEPWNGLDKSAFICMGKMTIDNLSSYFLAELLRSEAWRCKSDRTPEATRCGSVFY